MQSSTSHRVVLYSALLVFGVGWFNAAKQSKLPSKKFIVGTGITFTALSFLSDVMPEVASSLALAIDSTVLFVDNGGILRYFNDHGEITKTAPQPPPRQRLQPRTTHPHGVYPHG